MSSRVGQKKLNFYLPQNTQERIQIFREMLTLPLSYINEDNKKIEFPEKFVEKFNERLEEVLQDKEMQQMVDLYYGYNISFYEDMMVFFSLYGIIFNFRKLQFSH